MPRVLILKRFEDSQCVNPKTHPPNESINFACRYSKIEFMQDAQARFPAKSIARISQVTNACACEKIDGFQSVYSKKINKGSPVWRPNFALSNAQLTIPQPYGSTTVYLVISKTKPLTRYYEHEKPTRESQRVVNAYFPTRTTTYLPSHCKNGTTPNNQVRERLFSA